MIRTRDMIPIILEKCPAFLPRWEKHREFWKGEEAGIYNDIGEFATFVVDAYERREVGLVSAVFAIIERFFAEGDEEVRAAAGVGFLEDIRNISSWRPFGSTVFVQWLGPLSTVAWSEIERMWQDKKSLADVVRAEQQSERSKRS